MKIYRASVLMEGWKKMQLRIVLVIGSLVLCLILLPAMAMAKSSTGNPGLMTGITESQIALAVLGEALHDPESMRYMAHAVINRVREKGSFQGIYGYKVAKGRHYSLKAREMASNSVKQALLEADPTHNSTHWLSDYDLKHCKASRMAWRFKMVETCYIGQTHFYRVK